jgi:hypothetical protein
VDRPSKDAEEKKADLHDIRDTGTAESSLEARRNVWPIVLHLAK